MKMNLVLISLVFVINCFTACREEDDLTSNILVNSYLPAPDATDEESQLRRDFFESTGCYVLFNDTLRHEYLGVNAYGDPCYDTEILSLAWNMSEIATYKVFAFEYLMDIEQKRMATDFVENYLIPYVQNVLPYSLLLVNQIDVYDVEGGIELESSPVVYSNVQCLALDVSGLWEEEVDKESYAQEICCDIILSSWGGDPSWGYSGSKADDFFDVNFYDYDNDKMDEWYNYNIPYGLGNEYIEKFYQLGFLENTHETLLPSAREDAIAYIKACLFMTEDEFMALYGKYPNVVTKYKVIKPLVDETGIQF